MSIVVWLGEPFLKKFLGIRKYTLLANGDVLKFQKYQFSRDKSPCGSFIDIEELLKYPKFHF